MMDERFYENCLKAARARMVHYTTAEDWEAAQYWRVERHKYEHESHAAAFARLLDSDPEMQALDMMRRQARDVAKVGRPRKYKPKPVSVTKAEQALFKLALRHAQEHGCSFEQGFVAVSDTEEGRPLYKKLMEARN